MKTALIVGILLGCGACGYFGRLYWHRKRGISFLFVAIWFVLFAAWCGVVFAAPCPTQDGLWERTTSVDTVWGYWWAGGIKKPVVWGIDTTIQWEPLDSVQWEPLPDTSSGVPR